MVVPPEPLASVQCAPSWYDVTPLLVPIYAMQNFNFYIKFCRYTWEKNGKPYDWQVYDDRISQQPGRGTLVITSPRDEDIGKFSQISISNFSSHFNNKSWIYQMSLSIYHNGLDYYCPTLKNTYVKAWVYMSFLSLRYCFMHNFSYKIALFFPFLCKV